MSTEYPQPPRYCIYEDKPRTIGERWQSAECVNCVCEEDGEPSCQATLCKSCENAIPPAPGECCPHCPPRNATRAEPKQACHASMDNCALTCEHGFLVDENDCPLCSCVQDKVRVAEPRPYRFRLPTSDFPFQADEDATTERPDADLDACLPVPHCEPSCELSKDEDGCPVCACQPPQVFDEPANDTVLIDGNGKKICPELKCDLHCERGLLMDENDCTFCKCRAPDADCPPLIGCRKRCTYGYKTNRRGCPVSRSIPSQAPLRARSLSNSLAVRRYAGVEPSAPITSTKSTRKDRPGTRTPARSAPARPAVGSAAGRPFASSAAATLCLRSREPAVRSA